MRETLTEFLMQLRAAWRYRWTALLVAWLVAIAGWFVVFTIPDKYEASARVYVDTDSVLRPLLKGLAIQTDVNQRLSLMSKTLLSRPNMVKIARETDLDLAVSTDEETEKLLIKLQKNISLKRTRKQNLYTITYQNKNPKLAKDVVQALLTIFVEQTLGDTRQDSNSAQRFLVQQIAEYEARLIKAENILTEFKRKHVGNLPGQGGGIFVRHEKTKLELEAALLALKESKYRRNELKKQFEDAKKSISAGIMKQSSPIDNRILILQNKLDQLLLRFTDEHPDVKEIKETIVELEKQKMIPAEEDLSADNFGKNVLLEQLKLELSKSEAEYAGSRVRVVEYKKRMALFEEQLKVLPQVETELKRLNRDYNLNKTNYNALLSRLESAKIAESADAAGDNVKFKIIEPPRLPIIPIPSKRPVLSIAVLLIGFSIGGGVAFLLSQLNPVILDIYSLRKLTGYPVFGSISRIWTPSLLFKRKLEVNIFVLAGITLVIASVGVWYLNAFELDMQWMKDLRGNK